MTNPPLASVEKQKSGYLGEWLFLAALIAVLIAVNIPAQLTNIQTDPDFTAWGMAEANQMGPGARLYDFGNHIPVAPLTYFFLYEVSRGHGTWLMESFWNQVAIMGTLLVMAGIICTTFKRNVTFVSAIATLGLYSKCHTVLLYCSGANFLVACLAGVCVFYIRRTITPYSRYLLAAIGLLAAMVLLSKQSIGVLTLPATAFLILTIPRSISFRERIFRTVIFTFCTVIFTVLICWLMSPVVSISGMVNDVFLTGAECKGGTGEIIGKLIGFAYDVGGILIFTLLALLVARGLGLVNGREGTRPAFLESQKHLTLWLAGVLLAGVIFALASARLQFFVLPDIYQALVLGLAPAVVLAIAAVFQHQLKGILAEAFFNDECSLLGILTVILLPAAAGYNLSEYIGWRSFLWFVDSIPFIFVAITAIVYLSFKGLESFPPKLSRHLVSIIAVCVLAMTWQPWRVHWAEIKSCVDTWSGVAWFNGAKVTSRARPLLELVNEVKSLTQPKDTVLFLPDDPNLEQCFDRPRPTLNCPIVFADQYWKRYVSDDFQILKKSPPKVIIIGPRDNWVNINDEHNDSEAAKSLIQQVQSKLLPTLYRLADAHQINYGYGVDYLDVWVRVD